MKTRGFLYGLRQSLTIGVGYAPVAVTFGILAIQNGLGVWDAGLMSFLVFAGAAQFIAIQLIGQGAGFWVVAATTLVINIRHLLMSFSMLRFFPGISLPKLAGIAQGITDESFVLNSRLLEEVTVPADRVKVALGVNLGAFSFWVIFTFIGALIGNRLPVQFSGFNFALLALFIVLTVGTLTKNNLRVYILAALLAVIFKIFLPGKIYLLLSVGLAAFIGAWLESRQNADIQAAGD